MHTGGSAAQSIIVADNMVGISSEFILFTVRSSVLCVTRSFVLSEHFHGRWSRNTGVQ